MTKRSRDAWARALTLRERAQYAGAALAGSLRAGVDGRLADWIKPQYFQQDGVWQERLASVGLSQSRFESILAAGPGTIVSSLRECPTWMSVLDTEYMPSDGPGHLPELGFASIAEPIIRRAARRLR